MKPSIMHLQIYLFGGFGFWNTVKPRLCFRRPWVCDLGQKMTMYSSQLKDS